MVNTICVKQYHSVITVQVQFNAMLKAQIMKALKAERDKYAPLDDCRRPYCNLIKDLERQDTILEAAGGHAECLVVAMAASMDECCSRLGNDAYFTMHRVEDNNRTGGRKTADR